VDGWKRTKGKMSKKKIKLILNLIEMARVKRVSYLSSPSLSVENAREKYSGYAPDS
jgi:hypothetical protein